MPQGQCEHPAIPWRAIIGLRHILAHEYGEIKHERMWLVVTERIPELISHLEIIVPAVPEEEDRS